MGEFRDRGKPEPERTTIPPRSDYRDRKHFLEEVKRAYDKGMTVQQIADVLGVSWPTAHNYLKDAGAKFRGRGPDKNKQLSRQRRKKAHEAREGQ